MEADDPWWQCHPWLTLWLAVGVLDAGCVAYYAAPWGWLKNPNTPAWLQAFGALTALGLSVWVPRHVVTLQKRQEEKRKAHEQRDVLKQQLVIMGTLLFDFACVATQIERQL